MKINIKVKPNSSKEEIIKISDEEYLVNLKKPAENNKANIELIKILRKYFKKDIKIIRGLKNKNKIIQIGDQK